MIGIGNNQLMKSSNEIFLTDDSKYRVVAKGNSIQVSSDWGVTFVQKTTTTSTAYDIKISSTGQYMLLTDYNNYSKKSSNYGETWSNITTIAKNIYILVAMSGSGQYQMITGEFADSPVWLSSNYGATWTDVGIYTIAGWRGCYISGDASYMAVADTEGVRESTNFGVTWGSYMIENQASRIMCSNTATYRTTTHGETSARYVKSSQNSGVSYSFPSSGVIGTHKVYLGTDMSLTGQYQFICTYPDMKLWKSNDYGVSFTFVRTNTLQWGHTMAVSGTGQYAISGGVNGPGQYLKKTSDYGVTWTDVTSLGIGSFNAMAMNRII